LDSRNGWLRLLSALMATLTIAAFLSDLSNGNLRW
jgi:hypothetical protein